MNKLMLDDFTRYKFLSGIKFSPNGRNCGFITHHMDVEENKYLSNIHILNDENKILKLTSLDEERSFIWKDDETLLFPTIRSKKDKERKEKNQPLTIYYEININGGEANRAFEFPINVSSLKILNENTYLLISSFDPSLNNFHKLSESEKEKALNEYKENKDYEVIDEIPFWANGQGFTNKQRNKLYIYKLSDNSLHPITDDFTDVEHIAISKNKKTAAIITSSFIDKKSITTELNIFKFEENTFEKISPIAEFNYGFCDFLGEKIVFIGSDMEEFGINQNPNVYLTDIEGTSYTKILDLDYSAWNSVGSDCRYGGSQSVKVDGDYLYFTTTEGKSSFINRIDSNGTLERLTEDNGSIDGFDVMNHKVYFIGLRGLKLQEIYSLSNEENQITNFNSWVINDKKLSKPESLTFTNEDGICIGGWVLKPVDYEKGKKYPAILNIHGGPKTVFGDIFYHEMQYWANQGYFVFYLNPRGSDGYGNEFADIRGKYGTIDYEDIMDFTDLVLINYPDIDTDRIGVTGGSYGGFMTNWIIGHTSRFKAAASQRSISNWTSFFGTTDIGFWFSNDQNAATPWTDHEKLWFHSPMKYADKVTTPTLFIHSDEDYRCWLPEGLQMFTALKYHGVDARLVMFKGENHELSRSGKPKHRIKRLKEITEWFDKYLK